MPTCPYTPPHPLNIDFPHLMLRHRAVENRQKNDLSPAAQQDNEEEFEWPHRDENVEVLSDTDRKLSLRPPSVNHYVLFSFHLLVFALAICLEGAENTHQINCYWSGVVPQDLVCMHSVLSLFAVSFSH